MNSGMNQFYKYVNAALFDASEQRSSTFLDSSLHIGLPPVYVSSLGRTFGKRQEDQDGWKDVFRHEAQL